MGVIAFVWVMVGGMASLSVRALLCDSGWNGGDASIVAVSIWLLFPLAVAVALIGLAACFVYCLFATPGVLRRNLTRPQKPDPDELEAKREIEKLLRETP